MGESIPILSVVIPTKNRYYYLKSLLEALLSEKSDEFEIIIQDNSDNNSEILNFLRTFKYDKRLKYNHTAGWLSVIDNCDLGVKAAKGEFVCMLGDDDGILIKHALNLVRYLKNNDISAANVNKLSYSWPDVKHKVWKEISGRLIIPDFKLKYSTLYASDEIRAIKKQGGALGLGKLPRVYHGFVKKTILDNLKSDTGTYFPGPSPDMANAVGICKYLNSYLYADFPVIISGHGKKSTGGLGSNKLHHGKIENQSHLPKNTISLWSSKIPLFWSGPTIYSESARRAFSAFNEEDQLNYTYLYACCLVYENDYKKVIYETINNYENKKYILIKVYFYIIFIFFKRLLRFIDNFIFFRFKKHNIIRMNNILEVTRELNNKYKSSSLYTFISHV